MNKSRFSPDNWFKRVFFLGCILLGFNAYAQNESELESASAALEVQLRNTISLWGGAWAAQIPQAYFDFYSEHYKAREFESRQAWMAERQRRIQEPEYIRIRLLDFELVEFSELLIGELTAVTRFTLIYERPGYSDRTYKELELLNRHGEWKISSEKNLKIELDIPPN